MALVLYRVRHDFAILILERVAWELHYEFSSADELSEIRFVLSLKILEYLELCVIHGEIGRYFDKNLFIIIKNIVGNEVPAELPRRFKLLHENEPLLEDEPNELVRDFLVDAVTVRQLSSLVIILQEGVH